MEERQDVHKKQAGEIPLATFTSSCLHMKTQAFLEWLYGALFQRTLKDENNLARVTIPVDAAAEDGSVETRNTRTT